MSRTDKDIPLHIRWLYRAQDEGVEHGHSCSDHTRIRSYERLMRFFPEHEKNLMAEYCQWLNDNGLLYRVWEDYLDTRYRESRYYGVPLDSYTVKGTMILPYAEEKVVFSKYCSDADDLRWMGSRWIDVRDGGIATCQPRVSYRSDYLRSKREPRASRRSMVRQSAHEAMKLHRAGLMDESYDDVELYEDVSYQSRECRCC